MRGGRWWWVLVLLVVGWSGMAIGAEPDPEEVRRRMEIYTRDLEAEAARKAPAPKPRPKPAPAPKPASKPAPKPAPVVDHDREAWQSAEKCGTAACFRVYLEDYPKGRYAKMARARLQAEAVSLPLKTPFAPAATSVTEPASKLLPGQRITAVVVEFQVRGSLDEQSGAIIADLMMAAIATTGRFVLRDRLPLSAAAKIAKASELGETGMLDPKTAAELGRLYGLDAVVTGGIYKLGDLITVTARLIDTRNAVILRSGQIQGKDIDTIQIKINDLAAVITRPDL